MKIAVAIASRGRPAAMIGAVMAAWRLRTGKHDVQFILGIDEDDGFTHKHALAFMGELEPVIVSPPNITVRGEVENAMLAASEALNPDVVTLMSDRAFVITPGWDEGLAIGVSTAPKRVVWWSCPDDKACVMPVIPQAYLRAIDYRWSTETHPFWWDDSAAQEIDLMLHGIPSMKIHPMYSGQRGPTQSARDFVFWLDVFRAMRPERRARARQIAAALEIPFMERQDVDQYFQSYDAVMRARCEAFEKEYGDPNPPTARYLAAKAKAERMMAEFEATK